MQLNIQPPDFTSDEDRRGIVELLLSYAGGPQAGGKAMSSAATQRVIAMLAGNPTAVVLLAKLAGRPVGLAVCVESFSTFRAEPVLNLHDLVVAPDHQNRGIGRQLLEAVEQQARQRGACAV
ncbi:MAG: GNAT family N-acetyltransferase, partial [Planctomycetales bacterium]|nr:GNAT family N-acetyltransferase [Planctomycetales bacterium]